MNCQQKINELKQKIETVLTPLIDSDYIYLDLPYHYNIGDTLIWEGEESFLKILPHKCLYKSSFDTYIYGKIPDKAVVLIHGGGNFGDVWRILQEFHLNIVAQYPNNKIIVFPQTVHYDSLELLRQDAEIMSKHKNLTICARDNVSYEMLKKYFVKNNILLLPDMAFCINPKKLDKYRKKTVKDILLFKRTDHEISTEITDYEHYITEKGKIEIREWPSIEQRYIVNALLYRISLKTNLLKRAKDMYADMIYRPFLVRLGVEFLSKYRHIYTTRLHGAILSVLLDKPVNIFDNSYGKNSSFYNTWLSDVENIKIIHK
jgi:pyruvyl transferase EpsO